MELKVIKKEYYVEFYGTNINEPYVMQSKIFKTPKSAFNWVCLNFDYVDDQEIEIYIMVMNWFNEDEYDIEQYGYIEGLSKLHINN